MEMQLKVSLAILACCLGLAPVYTAAQSSLPGSAGVPKADTANLSAATEKALRTAASANLFEVESSRLALARTQSAKIKEFADRMVGDHTRAANRAKQVLNEAGATMPPVMLVPAHQQQLDRLKATSNADFDRAYVEAQIQAHLEAIALVGAYAKDGDNPRLKALVAELLPTLQSHLQHARQLR